MWVLKKNRFKDDSSNFGIDYWCEIGNVFETGAKDGEERDSIGRKQFAGGSDRHPLFDHPLWCCLATTLVIVQSSYFPSTPRVSPCARLILLGSRSFSILVDILLIKFIASYFTRNLEDVRSLLTNEKYILYYLLVEIYDFGIRNIRVINTFIIQLYNF